MERARLGSSGLTVTRIGLGLAALGRPAYLNLGRERDLGGDRAVEILERRTHEMLDQAYGAGIRYVDAARSYGFAERFLSSWLSLRRLAPDALTVGSKWGYTYTGDWRMEADVHEVKDHSAQALRRQLTDSRRLLGAHLDLYQIHSATLETGVLDDREVVAELASLRASGVAVGLTVSGPRQSDVVRRALEVEVDGAGLFASVQATYNLLEPSVGQALAEAHAAGLGVIIKESLANGRLTHANRDPLFEPQRRALEEIARHRGTAVDAVAVAAVLDREWVDVVLSGAVTPEQLRSNAAALEVSLDEEDLARLESLAEPPNDYWSRRASMEWS